MRSPIDLTPKQMAIVLAAYIVWIEIYQRVLS